MKVIIGAYRGAALVDRALRSLEKDVLGWTEVTIVDDSGDDSVERALRKLSSSGPRDRLIRSMVSIRVVPLPRVGYTRAMQRVFEEARGAQHWCFWEEDFVATRQIDLRGTARLLDAHPELAQIVFLRNAVYPVEHVSGGVVEGMENRLGVKVERLPDGLLRHDATASGNPAVWRAGIAEGGWPQVKWSENRLTERLREQGWRFAWLEGEAVRHDGEHSGYGY